MRIHCEPASRSFGGAETSQCERPFLLTRGLGDESTPVETFHFFPQANVIRRTVCRRSGEQSISDVSLGEMPFNGDSDSAAAFDWAWLRQERPPLQGCGRSTVRVADLFSGCGGMTLGVGEACRALDLRMEAVFANDIDHSALDVFEANFPGVKTNPKRIEQLLDSEPGSQSSESERALVRELGRIDVLVGGPPCQGHSNLNNHTRRADSRNALFIKMARFAELFEPDHVIIENVIGVAHDKGAVFPRTWKWFERLGYHVDGAVVKTELIGVPQHRHRMLLVASRKHPISVLSVAEKFQQPTRNIMWACGDLMNIVSTRGIDAHPRAISVTQARIDYLFDHNRYNLPDPERPPCHRDKAHSYQTVYGRIYPDRPSPTITTGFMTMGRGRFVHPHCRRTLTAHEAARIQFFPDWFDFGERNRECYLKLIGNAVPSKLSYVYALELLR